MLSAPDPKSLSLLRQLSDGGGGARINDCLCIFPYLLFTGKPRPREI